MPSNLNNNPINNLLKRNNFDSIVMIILHFYHQLIT